LPGLYQRRAFLIEILFVKKKKTLINAKAANTMVSKG
jgi:hypothetical protein